MNDSIKENNRLRTQQLGNRPASEMTKREQMALHILSGIFKNDDALTYDEMVEEALTLTDLLIEKINSNL
jgi:hypothetical protein